MTRPASCRLARAAFGGRPWARGPLRALTRICLIKHINCVTSVFDILAEPNRRAILGLLVGSEQSVGQIERRLRMAQPTVSKHLRVLRDAGFVEATVDAQRRLYRLRPEPFQQVEAWLAPYRRFWSAHVDALERHLDRVDVLNRQRGITGERSGASEPRDRSEPTKRRGSARAGGPPGEASGKQRRSRND